MNIPLRTPDDIGELTRLIQSERNAGQRDRYRAALLVINGEMTAEIVEKLGRSRRFVQRWAYAYRDQGVEGFTSLSRGGSHPKLSADQEQLFSERFKSGPTEADEQRCTLRGKDAQRILEQEFKVKYTLGGAYDLLHRLGFSCLKPRPKHRKNDVNVMNQWLEDAPLFSSDNASNTQGRRSKSGSKMKPGSASKAR